MSVDLSDKKVLVVDDYGSMRNVIKKLVVGIGVPNDNIYEAEDGDVALEKLQKAGDYDIVISDWNMERMSGLDLLKNVRQSGGPEKDVVFVMATGEKTEENVIAARKAGADTYIGKPFNGDTLKKKIEGAVKMKSAA